MQRESGSGFYKCSPCPDFIKVIRVQMLRPQLWTSPGLGEKKNTIDNPVSELTCLPIYPKEFSLLLITSTCNNR